MIKHKAKDIDDLIDLVGAGNEDSPDPGPVIKEITLWDGRVVRATNYNGPRKPDIETDEDIIWNDLKLMELVGKLLEEGISFITKTGTGMMEYILEWTIIPAQN